MSFINKDGLSERCFSIASSLSNPICQSFEKCTHLFLPKQNIIYPEMAKMSSFQHMVYRVSNLAQSILLFVIGVPLAFVAKLCKVVAVQLSTKGFIYQRGNGEEKDFSWPFKVLKWNVEGIAGGLADTGPWEKRVGAIVKEIQTHGPDIIFLEEVYDYQFSQAIRMRLIDLYPHFYCNIGPKKLGASMGGMVITKFKPEEENFTYYPSHTCLGFIKFIGKGIFSFRIDDVWFFHSHLQHSKTKIPSDDEKKARKEQMDIIQEKIQGLEPTSRKVLIGDLNMNQQEMEELEMFKTFKKPDQQEPTYFPMSTLLQTGSKVNSELAETIDHCLIDQDNDKGSRYLAFEIVEGFSLTNPESSLSDHHGLLITFS